MGGTLLAGHAEGTWAAVGPVVCNANPATAVSWANMLLEYAPWTESAERGPVAHLPGHNSSYRRDLLLAYSENLELLMESESILHWTSRPRPSAHRTRGKDPAPQLLEAVEFHQPSLQRRTAVCRNAVRGMAAVEAAAVRSTRSVDPARTTAAHRGAPRPVASWTAAANSSSVRGGRSNRRTR
jgi:hypothetical protein